MNSLYVLASVGFCAASAALITSASALPTEEIPKTEPEYIAKVKTAAPASVVNKATITMPQPDGSSKAVQTGSNGFTCFIGNDGTPECDDQNAMEWRKALQANQAPRIRLASFSCWPVTPARAIMIPPNGTRTSIGSRPGRT